MAQSKATASRRPRRLTVERLLDRAEGFMNLKGLSASAAVTQAMPDDLLSITMEDLRVLVESALVSKLAQRRSRERYRETEKRSAQVQRLTSEIMGKINARVQKKAEVLARVTYVMHGVPTPLLTMTLDDHVSRRTEAQRTKTSAEGRYRFHDTAVKALKDSQVESIAGLGIAQIEELAQIAEEVWGQ